MSEMTSKTIRQISDTVGQKIGEVFGAILGKNVKVSTGEIQKVSANIMDIEYSSGLVTASVEGDQIPGSLTFWFTPEAAAAIVDLMVMGDGTAPFRPEEHLDGVSEAIHQVVESLALDWRNEGFPVSFKSVVSNVHDDPKSYSTNFTGQPIIRLEIEIDTFGEAGIWLLIDPQLAMLLVPPTVSDSRGAQASAGGVAKQAPAVNVRPAVFAPFDGSAGNEAEPRNLDLLLDVSLPVTIELGRTSMLIRDVLDLGPGSVVELDKLSGEPVDLYVNDRKFARGEVVVVDEYFGVRITELMHIEDRLKSLRG